MEGIGQLLPIVELEHAGHFAHPGRRLETHLAGRPRCPLKEEKKSD